MTKIIFFDFDNTLYSHTTSSFPKSSIKALKKLKEKGILTYLCTGRALLERDNFDMRDVVLDGMILSSGQVVISNSEGLLYEKTIEGELKDVLIRLFNEKTFPIYFCTPHDMILNYCNATVRHVQSAISSGVPEVKPYNNEKIYMASAFFDEDKTLKEIMALKDQAEITIWHEGALDIVPKGMSKVSGIKAVCEHYNIPVEETMCFGDGDNDITMLDYCGTSIAMGNAPDFVKEHADYICDHIDKDGLAKALKHFKLI
jgi:Cof subfamily protein (haloacid dehalogenase superfamily)